MMTSESVNQNRHPYIRRLAFFLTERCNARCRHCVYGLDSPPTRGSDMMPDELPSWLEQGAEAGIREVCFTGGEPFLASAVRCSGARRAVELGVRAGVITNAFWATSLKTACRKLEPLRGLRELSISADRFHQEHIPFERVRTAILAARTVGITPRVKLAFADQREVTVLRDELADILSPDEIDADPIRNVGRMVEQREISLPTSPTSPEAGCPMTRVLTVMPAGRVGGCCGPILSLPDHPLWFGSLRAHSLCEILRAAELRVVYQFLRLRGPYALYGRLAGEVKDIPFDLSSPCALCYGLLAAPRACTALAAYESDPELFRELAVERLIYFGEPAMLARLPASSALAASNPARLGASEMRTCSMQPLR